MKPDGQATYQLLKAGHSDAVALLYRRYGRKLYSYGLINWKVNEDDNWELVYQTLYKVLETYERYQFESEQKFGALVFKVYINYLRNHYRDTQRMKEKLDIVNFSESLFEDEDEGFNGTEREVKLRIVARQEAEARQNNKADSPAMKLLKAELAKLEDWQRMLLLLRSQNMPYTEIARHIDKPADQLKVYYQRLKKRIYKRINPEVNARKHG